MLFFLQLVAFRWHFFIGCVFICCLLLHTVSWVVLWNSGLWWAVPCTDSCRNSYLHSSSSLVSSSIVCKLLLILCNLGEKWARFITSIISVILLHVLVTVSVPCSIISCTSNFIHKARVATVETVYCVLGDVLDLFCLENLGGKRSFCLC